MRYLKLQSDPRHASVELRGRITTPGGQICVQTLFFILLDTVKAKGHTIARITFKLNVSGAHSNVHMDRALPAKAVLVRSGSRISDKELLISTRTLIWKGAAGVVCGPTLSACPIQEKCCMPALVSCTRTQLWRRQKPYSRENSCLTT